MRNIYRMSPSYFSKILKNMAWKDGDFFFAVCAVDPSACHGVIFILEDTIYFV